MLAGSGLDRAALVGLDVEHSSFCNAEVELVVRDAGDGVPRTISRPRAAPTWPCPPWTLEQWLQASDTRYGPASRKIDR